ncbi:hypothetical protein D9M70_605040 [compost metagenome]
MIGKQVSEFCIEINHIFQLHYRLVRIILSVHGTCLSGKYTANIIKINRRNQSVSKTYGVAQPCINGRPVQGFFKSPLCVIVIIYFEHRFPDLISRIPYFQ